MEIIKLEKVNKSFGDKKVLSNFSLLINEGELIAITGSSGKGKTTILNILGLLEGFDKGSFWLDGDKNIKPNTSKATKIIREKISYLFQNFALVDEESVEYNLMLALRYVKISKRQKVEKIKEELSHMGLEGYEKKKIYELSGGEQQRVAVARIMLKPSKIVLADEPTGSLDEKNSETVFELLKKINNNGKTVIIVTHDKKLADKCDRIINI